MNKKVFISYSWGNLEHQNWIINLATRLMNDTVDVVLDRWSLKDGQDIYSFMEEMVSSEDIFRVLIVCNSKYAEKADDRKGGVGTETQIITPNIYSNQKQEKFIPIVLERNEENEPCLPIYLQSRKYIDFSREESFEDSYEELLRNILEAPSIPKPKLGTIPPLYITENTINLSETNSKLRTIENQIKKNNNLKAKYGTDFIEVFLDNLWEFEQKNIPSEIIAFGEELHNTLKSYKPLREDFIKFIDLISNNEIESAEEIFIDFFEHAPVYQRPKEDVGGWHSVKFDIFKIIFHELFLYTISICLKNKNYTLVASLLHSKYYSKGQRNIIDNKPERFTFLYQYHENLERYYSKAFNKITGFGDYIITNLSVQIKKEDIILGDTLCYFVSYMDSDNGDRTWFPNTHLYGERSNIVFFEKVTSKKHFDRVKEIFDVTSSEELKEILENSKKVSKDKIRYGNGTFNYIPFIHEIINPETIAIYR